MLISIQMQKIIFRILILQIVLVICSCSSDTEKAVSPYPADVAHNPVKDSEIQRYNIDQLKAQKNRFECDTISVIEFVLNNYSAGTYLMETDRTTLYSLPKPAVIYHNEKDGRKYIFAVIASSGSGKRLVETSNLIGYNESYIDLDSTKLGTPYLYLILLECTNGSLSLIWQSVIPSHGGFKDFTLKYWNDKQQQFIQTDFYYAQGIGTISYNFFMVNGIRELPHLLMTYDGIDFKRTIINFNNDDYPDYYEYVYVSNPERIYAADSVAFYWQKNDNVYVNSRNSRQTRPY